MPSIESIEVCTPEIRTAIVAPLDAFSRTQGFVWNPSSLVLALRGEQSQILGGLLGQIHWGWLRIEILAVAPALRGAGWGRRLMEEAEHRARQQGCEHAWVDTFTFQAPGFYQRLGYEVFAELPDYPAGQTRLFLRKRLTPFATKQKTPTSPG